MLMTFPPENFHSLLASPYIFGQGHVREGLVNENKGQVMSRADGRKSEIF